MKEYKLAIVGATGLVGRTVLKVLEEKNLPISKYRLFASQKSAEKKIHFMNQNYIVGQKGVLVRRARQKRSSRKWSCSSVGT